MKSWIIPPGQSSSFVAHMDWARFIKELADVHYPDVDKITLVIELNVLHSQCLNRRIDRIEDVKREVKAWQEYRNNMNSKVNWQFTTEDARVKLKKLYPSIEE